MSYPEHIHDPNYGGDEDDQPEPQTPAIERFAQTPSGCFAEHPMGKWVLYSSIALLLADRERLQTENEILRLGMKANGDAFNEEVRLRKAEVERLTRENTEAIEARNMALEQFGQMDATVDGLIARADAAERRAEALTEAIREYFTATDARRALNNSDIEAPFTELKAANLRREAAETKLRALLAQGDTPT